MTITSLDLVFKGRFKDAIGVATKVDVDKEFS